MSYLFHTDPVLLLRLSSASSDWRPYMFIASCLQLNQLFLGFPCIILVSGSHYGTVSGILFLPVSKMSVPCINLSHSPITMSSTPIMILTVLLLILSNLSFSSNQFLWCFIFILHVCSEYCIIILNVIVCVYIKQYIVIICIY